MSDNIPFGPWGNPRLDTGFYPALITNVCHIENGEDRGLMLEFTFSLEASGLVFISRLYMPQQFSAKCQHRLWYFCQAIGLEGYELIEDPDVAVGRRLVLEVTTIHPTKANHGNRYSDVKRFLPYPVCDQEFDDATKKTAV